MGELDKIFEDEYRQRALEAAQKYMGTEPKSELGRRVAKLLPIRLGDWAEVCAELQAEHPGAQFAIIWPHGQIGMVLEVRQDG